VSWFQRLLPAAAFQFCFVAAVSMLKPVANALTLARYDTKALPWLYVSAAILTGALSAWAARRQGGRAGPSGLAWLGALCSLGLLGGVGMAWPGTPLVAYLFAETFATQVSLSFWGRVADAFDAREARRAFSVIHGLGMTGGIAGGALAQLASRVASTTWLLGTTALAFVLAGVAFQAHRSALIKPSVAASSAPLAWGPTLRLPYVRLLGGVVLSFSVISVLTDFAYRQRAVAFGEAGMAGFFGANQLWTAVFCVAFQLLAAEKLLRRLGILRYVALIPLTMALASLVAITWPNAWASWALKLLESAASWSLLPVAYQLLYAPLPDEQRDGIRRFIDGFWRKGGLAVAGFGLVGLAAPLGASGVLVLAALVCVAAAGLLVRMRGLYVAAVQERVAGSTPTTLDGSFDRLLEEALTAPSAERALRAAQLLQHAGRLRVRHARALLAHPHEKVQERGVRAALELVARGLAVNLEQLTLFGARRPRDAAVWALARLAPDRALAVLPPLMSSADIGLAASAVGGVLTARADHPAATQQVEHWLATRDVAPTAQRREVARLLGRLPQSLAAPALPAALDDADATVRRLAIAAVGEGGHLGLAGKLLKFLAWRDERRPARTALAALGDAVVPLLRDALDDRSRALSLRLQLPRVLRQVGTQAAFDALLFSNPTDEAALHYRIGLALMQLHQESDGLTVDAVRVGEALGRRRLTRDALRVPLSDVVAALGPTPLLCRVLKNRWEQSLELSFWLLGLLHDGRVLRRAHAQLTGTDARRRAWAVELLENVLPPQHLAQVRDGIDPAWAEGEPHRMAEQVRRLGDSDDLIVRTCARHLGRRLGVWPQTLKENDMSEAVVRRLFALEGVEIFQESDVDDLTAVASLAKEQRFAAGEELYDEGDPGDALYVIVSGQVEARRGGEVVLSLKAKDAFGETSLFDGAPRVNSAVAVAPTEVLVIDRRDFLDLLVDRPELLAGLFRIVSRQLKSMVVEVTAARRISLSEMPAIRPAPPVPDDG
jgi:hypothetical protein